MPGIGDSGGGEDPGHHARVFGTGTEPAGGHG
jgi:hypothetical protein